MRGQSASTIELTLFAKRVLEENHPMTLRQLHYAIFSLDQIDYANDKSSYQRLSRVTTTARRLWRCWELDGEPGPEPELGIQPNHMIDETRAPETVSLWKNSASYIDAVRRSYRRNLWQDQMTHVEVWAEKATILGAIRPVADKWGVTLRVTHGFGSTGMENQIGTFFEGLDDKYIKIFYLGDHDASGHVIESDIHRRVETAAGISFSMERLAIHAQDIKKFNLPPQAIKESDSRAKSFRKQFGKNARTVELDALPVAELRRRVDEAIEGLIEFETWDRQLHVQEVELESIRDFADTIKNLPQADA